MRLTLPIWIFEPTTSLSRMAEGFQFSNILDRAARSEDPVLRDALVTAFVLSTFAHTERVKKPFNPVLGETYHFVHHAPNMHFYAEQVSHHPPISAGHVQGDAWHATEVVHGQMTFHGTSVELTNVGSRLIQLTKTNDRYTWTLPRTLLSNFLIGNTTVDHIGTVQINNNTTGTQSILDFPKRAWFGTNQNAVTGYLSDRSGSKLAVFNGIWNGHFEWQRLDGQSSKSRSSTLWFNTSQHQINTDDSTSMGGPTSNWTSFTKRTVHFDDKMKMQLLPTDSRLRPDRIALQKGDSAQAAEEKLRVEQLQRERRTLTASAVASGGKPYAPRFFEKASDELGWKPKGTYWMQLQHILSEEERAKASLW